MTESQPPARKTYEPAIRVKKWPGGFTYLVQFRNRDGSWSGTGIVYMDRDRAVEYARRQSVRLGWPVVTTT